jgi:hypothetical protein
MSAAPSKVINVGGGGLGMTTTRSSYRASIKFVLLPSRLWIDFDEGRNPVLSSMGMRDFS